MLIGRRTAKSHRQSRVGKPLPDRSAGAVRRLAPPFCCPGLTLLLAFAFGLPFARADIQVPAKGRTRGERQIEKLTPPPSPVAAKVRLEPGGRAEIILQATGSLGKTVDFLLRTPPAHGGFEGAPRRIDHDRVAVMYVHRAADGPGRDAFTFAAQAPGTPVSAAETVEIDVVDNNPAPAPAAPGGVPDVAASPSELDFGAVEAGHSSGLTLALENRGGGRAVGRLDLPAPWMVDGESTYRLDRGGRQTFRVVFRPLAEGSFAETLRVQAGGADSTAGCVVRMIGTGLAAGPAPSPSPSAEPLVAAAPAATPAPAASVPPSPAALVPVSDAGASVHAAPGASDPAAPVAVNESRITGVAVRAVGTTTVELAWKPPSPPPRSYRIERRSFAHDERETGAVRIDWLLYERTEFRVRADQVTATLRGLVPGEPITVRVVSVDGAGQLSPPSPNVDATTIASSTWWQPTPLKTLLLALAVCAALVIRRRWQDRQLLRELDARHLARDDDSLSYAPK